MHGVVSPEAMLSLVATGDREAFRSLYRATSGTAYAIALGVVRERDTAQEIVQEAFVRVWEHAARFDPAKGTAAGWIAVITRRLALNEIRRRKGAPVAFDDAGVAVDTIAGEAPSDKAGLGKSLEACLGRLSSDHRTAVVLAYVHGFTHEELARRLDRPLGTVKSWVRRGLSDLKECMG